MECGAEAPRDGAFVEVADLIAKLRAQGVDFDFVTEDEYNAFIAANTPPPPWQGINP